ncbi:unnamed protein product [Calypogeia fissa]
MRGGDGSGGVSALEPHLVHANTEQQQPGRGPRRSPRTHSHIHAGNGGSHRGDSQNGFLGNASLVSSIDPEGSSRTATSRVLSAEEISVRATVRGGDGGALAGPGALSVESRQVGGCHSIKESSRRHPRRGSRVEPHLKRGTSEGPLTNGFPVDGASSSMEPPPAGRLPRSVASSVVPRKKGRRGHGGVDSNGVHENNPLKHGKSRVLNSSDGPSVIIVQEEPQQAEVPERERVGEYFPLIHDELGLQCLTRMPRHKIYEMAMVCKKWREYLQGPELYKARRLLGVREDWVFLLGLNVDKNWRAFRPDVGDWVSIPSCPSDYTFDSCDKESMVAGLNLLVLGQNKDGYVIWKFDTISCTWSTTPRMNTDRCMFGSATFGKYAYFAGGTSRGTILKSVERYDSETNSWESLAEMNHDRKACSGFVMDGKFHVIGGHVSNNVLISSGEAYDPLTGTWTVIEGMWPNQFVPNTQVSPPLVAVLNNQLYAINIIHNMLMLYDKGQNAWRMLEKVPFRAENTNGWGLGFKSVGDELFVIGGARGPQHFLPKIHAYKPRTDEGDTWRHVTDLKIPTNGFIYNCAVMSG